MKDLRGKVAVVTGAASGIGRGLSQALATEGCHLALSDIDEGGLAETAALVEMAEGRVTTHRLDVADRKAVYAHSDEVLAAHGHADIVINNAGVTVIESLEEVTFEDFEWVMGINFWGVVYGSKAFLPHLRTRPESSLVNISSVNAFLPFPHNGPYNCSKYAVCGFNETLHQELAGTSVVVSSVHPGGVRTNVARNSRFRRHLSPAVTAETAAQTFERMARTSSKDAARTIVAGIRKKKHRILVGADAYVIEAMKRIAPESSVGVTAWLMRRLAQQEQDRSPRR